MRKKAWLLCAAVWAAVVLTGCGSTTAGLEIEEPVQELERELTEEEKDEILQKLYAIGEYFLMEKAFENNSARDLFADTNVVDLGNNCIAYPVPNGAAMDLFMSDKNFTGDRYIAIYSLDFGFRNDAYSDGYFYYLPDDYGTITEMKMEESNVLCLKYAASVSGETEEVRIPFYFPSRMTEDFLDMDDHASFERYKKMICASQEGLMSGEEDVFPQTVWTEVYQGGEESYEAVFERLSPMYDFFAEHTGKLATYRLTVKDEIGDVVWEQMLLNYPAKYEDPHWFVDFTGDGYLDIALCTNVYWGKAVGWYSTLHVLIWNPETSSYEESKLPKGEIHQWNEGLSSMIVTVDNNVDMYSYLNKEMYTYLDGEWKMTGRLQAVYSEDEYYTGTNEPVLKGFQELFYSEDGTVVKERMLGTNEVLDVSNIWNIDNTENLKLYPDYPLWHKEHISVGGIDVNKYVEGDYSR